MLPPSATTSVLRWTATLQLRFLGIVARHDNESEGARSPLTICRTRPECAHGMRRQVCARTAVQRPWHTPARCLIALAVLGALADGRQGGHAPTTASAEVAGDERVDISRKIAMWRSRSGGEATAADCSEAVRLSTYRPRPHEAPLSAQEASARLRRWRAGGCTAQHTQSAQEGLQHGETQPPSALCEAGDAAAPVQTAASDRLGAWRKRRVAGHTAPEAVAGPGGVGAGEGPERSAWAQISHLSCASPHVIDDELRTHCHWTVRELIAGGRAEETCMPAPAINTTEQLSPDERGVYGWTPPDLNESVLQVTAAPALANGHRPRRRDPTMLAHVRNV